MAIYFFIFSNFLKTLYNTLLPFFSYLAYFYKYFDRKELNVHHFVDMHVTTGVTQYFYLDSRQPLIILHSKLYSVCLSKYQDHSKPLKHLAINIWSATNTFRWLIPVVTSTKLPLMRSKIYPRWRESHYFKWKYFKN